VRPRPVDVFWSKFRAKVFVFPEDILELPGGAWVLRFREVLALSDASISSTDVGCCV